MGSTRLPGKVLCQLGTRTVLAHVVGRLRKSGAFDDITLATSTREIDDRLEAAARALDVRVFRGSETDVLSRYFEAAAASHADVVARITADCPLIDPGVVAAMVGLYKDASATAGAPDLVTNARVRTFPRGLDTEIFSTAGLAIAHAEANKPHQREHVTPFFYEHPERFRILDYFQDKDLSHLRLTLDTPEDLELLTRIFAAQAGAAEDDIGIDSVVELLARHPEWLQINAHVQQKSV
jgi:spore coat polysaccharide biosynthesis protein SpsF